MTLLQRHNREISSCTIAYNSGAGTGTSGAGIQVEGNHPEQPTVQLFNSIVYFNPPSSSVAPDNISVQQPGQVDVLNSNVGKPYFSLNTLNHIDMDPEFKNPTRRNLRLKITSPCIESGDDSVIPLDVLDVDENTILQGPVRRDFQITIPVGLPGSGGPQFRQRQGVNTHGITFGFDQLPSGPIVDMGAYESGYLQGL